MSRCLSFVLLLSLAACSRNGDKPAASAAAAPGVLARVGNGEIRAEDFVAYAAVRSAPGSAVDRAGLLDEMVSEEALAQRARAAGLDRTPAFRRAMRDFLTTRLRESELLPLLEKASAVSDSDLAAAIREAAPRLGQPAARRLAWLRVMFENNSDAARTAATTRLREAAERWSHLPPDAARRGFGPIAAEFSDDPDTRYQGGDLGWFTEGSQLTRLPAAAAAAAAALQTPGTLTEPVLLADSGCLLLLLEQRDTEPADPANIRERVRQELIARRRAEAETEWRAGARSAVEVSVDQQALQALSLPLSAPASPSQPPERK